MAVENNSETQYSKKLVAFVDILGFSDLIEDDDNADFNIQALDNNLQIVASDLEKSAPHVSVSMFSDCICIACDPGIDAIWQFVSGLATLQLQLAVNGIFIRGAIAYDRHFANSRMIFSKGLVTAYRRQNELAVHPRILIMDEVDGSHPSHGFYMFDAKAPDGLRFVDYLEAVGFMKTRADKLETFREHKGAILAQVAANLHKPAVVSKYLWLADYHNAKFERFFDATCAGGSDEDMILRQQAYIDVLLELPSFLGGTDIDRR